MTKIGDIPNTSALANDAFNSDLTLQGGSLYATIGSWTININTNNYVPNVFVDFTIGPNNGSGQPQRWIHSVGMTSYMSAAGRTELFARCNNFSTSTAYHIKVMQNYWNVGPQHRWWGGSCVWINGLNCSFSVGHTVRFEMLAAAQFANATWDANDWGHSAAWRVV